MKEIVAHRMTARLEEEFVVFPIGFRINRFRNLSRIETNGCPS